MLGIAGVAYAGDGTANNPYSVEEVRALAANFTASDIIEGVYVQGYIVGSIPQSTDGSSTYIENTEFSTKNASNSNMVIADGSSEDDTNYCIAVQLPNGDVRSALNLQANPNNLGHQVKLYGDIQRYFGAPGFKNVTSFEWIGGEPSPSEKPEVPQGTLTVAEALSFIAAGGTGEITVTGFISGIDEVSTSYGNATYSIVDDLSQANNALVIFRGYWLDGEKFTSADQIAYGGKVVVKGEAVNYNGTPELTTGSQILSYTAPSGDIPTPTPPTKDDKVVAYVADGYNYTGSAVKVCVVSGTQEAGNQIGDKTWTIDGVCSLDFTMNNSSISYVTGGAVRWYKNDEMTFTPVQGVTITGICVVGGTANNKVCPGGVCSLTNINGTPWNVVSDAEATWDGTLTSAFTIGNTAQVRWQYIELTLAEGAGVDEVLAADDSQAVYYNLQGQKVLNPERGIFIKVVNGKAVKVVK